MTRVVLFQLYAPLASWGGEAVGDHRPSHGAPTRSAVLGLVAAALGLDHNDESGHRELQAAYRLAVETWKGGDPLEDYHTIQNPRMTEVRAAAKKGEPVTTRSKALGVAAGNVQTVVSLRGYRQDSFHRVVLWPTGDEVEPSPERVVQALLAPRWALHLGRRSCPPALPLDPRVVEGEDLVSIVQANAPRVPDSLRLGGTEARPLTWERGIPAGAECLQEAPIRDARRGATRTFAVRDLLKGELR